MRRACMTILMVLMTVLLPVAAGAVEAPHNYNTTTANPPRTFGCNECHLLGRSSGLKQFVNLCYTCHQYGTKVDYPVSAGDSSNIFNTVTTNLYKTKPESEKKMTSHNWVGPDNNAAAGAVAPTTGTLYKSAVNKTVSCARCHWVHSSGTAYQQNKPLLRMANDEDQMCFECHKPRKTRDHKAGTHPVTFHYASTATIRGASWMKTTPQNSNPENPTSDLNKYLKKGRVVCSTCHRVHKADSNSATYDSYSTNSMLPPATISAGKGMLLRTDMVINRQDATVDALNICNNCHNYKNHSTAGQGVQCADCHGSHVEKDPATGLPNGWLIRRYLNYSAVSDIPGGQNVRKVPIYFTSTSNRVFNFYSTAKGRTGICIVCHNRAKMDSNAQHNFANYTTGDRSCRTCHKHKSLVASAGAFTAPEDIFACGNCHGMPPKNELAGDRPKQSGGYAVYSTSSGRAAWSYKDTYPTYYKDERYTPHTKHSARSIKYSPSSFPAGTYPYECKECHKNYDKNRHRSAVAGPTFQTVFVNTTTIDPFVVKAALFNQIPTYTLANAAGRCDNVYCHSNGAPRNASYMEQVDFTRANFVYSKGEFAWKNMTSAFKRYRCTACHDAKPTTNAHNRHNVTKNYGCYECHATVVLSNNTSIYFNPSSRLTLHADGNKDVSFSTSGTTWTTGSNDARCTNGTCHFSGKSGVQANVEANWVSGTFPKDCSGCHGGAATSTYPISTDAHTAHVNNPDYQAAAQLRCAECHAKTVNFRNLTTVIYQSRHLNAFVEYSGRKAPKAGFNAGSKTCSTYCHTNGAGTTPLKQYQPDWDAGASMDCKGCHGAEPQGAGFFASIAGEPNYNNISTSLRDQFNSHEKHSKICYDCHKNTTEINNPQNKVLGAYSSHINKRRDVNFDTTLPKIGGSAAYTATTKRCSNVACHGGTQVRWGASLATDCTGCHKGAIGSSNPYTLTESNNNKHRKHLNNYFVCATCHRNIVFKNLSVSDPTRHGNGYYNYSGAFTGRYVNSVATRTGCVTSYCHSSGQSNLKSFAFFPMTSTGTHWKTTSTFANPCKACHGAYKPDALAGADYASALGNFTSQFGEPNYRNFSSATRERFNSHSKKHNAAKTDCQTCHYGAVREVSNTLFVNTTSHLDGTRMVAFDPARVSSGTYSAAGKTCTNVSCHGGTGTIRWGGKLHCGGCHPYATMTIGHQAHIDMNNVNILYNYTANRSSGSEATYTDMGYKFGCSSCHPLNEQTYHTNGSVEVTLYYNEAGVGTMRAKNTTATYNQVNGYDIPGSGLIGSHASANIRCTAAYCHSNGMAGSSFRTYTTPIWNVAYNRSTNDRCAMCHGNSPNSGGKKGSAAHFNVYSANGVYNKPRGHFVGIHYDNVFSGGAGFFGGNRETSGHGNAGSATSINCNTCHYSVVKSTANDKNNVCGGCHGVTASVRGQATIDSRALHVNGSVDIAFNQAVRIKSKAQIRTMDQPPQWTRINGYKQSGSYDNSFGGMTTAQVWKPALQKTCSNLACHNGLDVKWGDTVVEGSVTPVSCDSCH